MTEDETTPTTPPTPGIKPLESALAIGGFLLLCANVWADWQSDSYNGGVVSVALIVFVGTVIGKNMGNIVGGGR